MDKLKIKIKIKINQVPIQCVGKQEEGSLRWRCGEDVVEMKCGVNPSRSLEAVQTSQTSQTSTVSFQIRLS